MKSRIIEYDHGTLDILCTDGSVIHDADAMQLRRFLHYAKKIEQLTGDENNKWNIDVADISEYKSGEAKTIAYISDNNQIVINDFAPIGMLITSQNDEETKWISVPEYANLVNKSNEQVKLYCRQGRIRCKRVGKIWVIDSTSPLPPDRRKKI